MSKKEYKCVQCGKVLSKSECTGDVDFNSKIGLDPWCEECHEAEEQRLAAEDSLGGYSYSRPPKYVLPKEQWAEFRYE